MAFQSLILLVIGITLGVLGIAGLSMARAVTDTAVTAVVVDRDGSAVRVMVKDTEIARFDASGLHVTGDLSYSGTVVDTTAPQGGPSP